ncbi:hypothetical protein HY256_02175, partial [Candidatus Sumerlaeota bacterium]|nr:hypothetical protein [Candidatus Sumerlaeota bacterium]
MWASTSFAANVRLRAVANPPAAVVGETMTITLVLDSDDFNLDAEPSRPDFGGLTLMGGPSKSRQATIVNGTANVSLQFSYA